MTIDPHEGLQATEFMDEGSARSLFANAYEYREAVHLLVSAYDGKTQDRMFRPLYHLCGICIELNLKAFLLERGTTRNRVRGLSHNLSNLLNDATDLGLVLDDQFREQIIVMSATARNGFFRYGLDRGNPQPPHAVSVPHLPTVVAAIEVLCWTVAVVLDEPWPEPKDQAGR